MRVMDGDDNVVGGDEAIHLVAEPEEGEVRKPSLTRCCARRKQSLRRKPTLFVMECRGVGR